VSFTFGSAPPEAVAALHAAGSEVWVTVTSHDEARLAVEAGADVVVVQGAEAGGHRATFVDRDGAAAIGLLALLQLVREAVDVPMVATGGIMTRRGVAAVLAAGARAAQLGTAFLLCPEAGTSAPHRRAVASSAPTALTRAFSGRQARGVRNRFMDAHDHAAPIAYPEVHHATSPLRAAARAAGDAGAINLWAGEAHALAMGIPAAEVVRALAPDGPA
jgi:nitronate monooxygenase